MNKLFAREKTITILAQCQKWPSARSRLSHSSMKSNVPDEAGMPPQKKDEEVQHRITMLLFILKLKSFVLRVGGPLKVI